MNEFESKLHILHIKKYSIPYWSIKCNTVSLYFIIAPLNRMGIGAKALLATDNKILNTIYVISS